jgi:hypothetical protein
MIAWLQRKNTANNDNNQKQEHKRPFFFFLSLHHLHVNIHRKPTLVTTKAITPCEIKVSWSDRCERLCVCVFAFKGTESTNEPRTTLKIRLCVCYTDTKVRKLGGIEIHTTGLFLFFLSHHRHMSSNRFDANNLFVISRFTRQSKNKQEKWNSKINFTIQNFIMANDPHQSPVAATNATENDPMAPVGIVSTEDIVVSTATTTTAAAIDIVSAAATVTTTALAMPQVATTTEVLRLTLRPRPNITWYVPYGSSWKY